MRADGDITQIVTGTKSPYQLESNIGGSADNIKVALLLTSKSHKLAIETPDESYRSFGSVKSYTNIKTLQY